jgi:hypothetical protein
MRTNADITIYHKAIVSGAESWTSQQVKAVEWENRKAANVIASGLMEADSATVYIPFQRGEINANIGDYLVKGLVTDTISSAFTITALKAKYPDVVCIRSVDPKDFGSLIMRHWQIGAS